MEIFGGKEKFVLPLHSQTTGKPTQASGAVGSEGLSNRADKVSQASDCD